MILKIERYHVESVEDWWLLDDIRKISLYRFEDRPFSQNFADTDANIFLLDYEEYLKEMNAGQAHRDVIKLVCRTSSGNEFVVLFDTVGYILNDNGKTIEKLVANYR